MLYEFWAWWTEQMLSLIPGRLRQDGDGDGLNITLEEGEPPTVTVLARHGRRPRPLGAFRLDGKGLGALRQAATGRPAAIRLVLPAGLLLEKRLTLPLAAEREIGRVVAFEMDRETPFAADEVWWTTAIEARDKAEGRLDLRLSLVQRSRLTPVLSLLEQAGLRPGVLVGPGDDGGPRRIPLAGGAPAEGFWPRRLLPLACAACALLALAVGLTPLIRQSIALAAVEDRIALLKPQVDQAEALRRRIDGGGTGGDILAAELGRVGDPLKVLAAATAVLPDDTYLTEFTMRQRQVTLTGQSADAAGLIGALAHADASFKDPAFAAPVTRMKETNRDLFSIKVEARP